MRILTNVGLAPHWRASSGVEGEAVIGQTWEEFRAHVSGCDAVLVDCNPGLVMRLAALFVLQPRLRRPLIGSDVVLRKPDSLRARCANPLQRFLLSRVDHFLHPSPDLSGYVKYFGLRAERFSFYRFKPNLRYHCDLEPNPEGEYVLCLGRSMRDFDSFFAAVESLPYPVAIAPPDLARYRSDGSRFTWPLDRLPSNVRVIPHDPSSLASQAQILMGAKLVVVPLLKSCLVATGTPYNAMLLGKCTLVTEGPATHGLFTDEVLPIPAEDPAGIARVIERAWNDRELRESTAAKGYQLALSLGGTQELKQRLLDLTVEFMRRREARGSRPA